MIDRETFDLIKRKHGRYASWAVWAESRGSRKGWLADPDILDPDRNPTLLGALRNDVVMLGLNQSGREIGRPLGNFHEYNAPASMPKPASDTSPPAAPAALVAAAPATPPAPPPQAVEAPAPGPTDPESARGLPEERAAPA